MPDSGWVTWLKHADAATQHISVGSDGGQDVGELDYDPRCGPDVTEAGGRYGMKLGGTYGIVRCTAHSTQHTAHSTQHTAHSAQHTAGSNNARHTAHDAQHTAHNPQRRATHSTQHTQSAHTQ